MSTYFCKLVNKLYTRHWVSSSENADQLSEERICVVAEGRSQSEHKDVFLTFNQKRNCIDSFFADLMHKNLKYRNYEDVCKNLFYSFSWTGIS